MNSNTECSKPIGVLRNAIARTDDDGNIIQLEGFCDSHDYRKDLVGRYMYSSLVINKIDDTLFETSNSIYKITNWATPTPEVSKEEMERIEKYFASLIV